MKSSLFKITAGLYLLLLTAVSATATASTPSSRNSRHKKRTKDSNGKSYPVRDCNSGHNATARLVSSRTDCSKGAVVKRHEPPLRRSVCHQNLPYRRRRHRRRTGPVGKKAQDGTAKKPASSRKWIVTARGVTRYVLVPTGDYADRIEAAMEAERGHPSTCNEWGSSNSGRRYFGNPRQPPGQSHLHGNRTRAASLRSGKYRPHGYSPTNSQGELVIGHEVRTFTSCGDTMVYWIKDLTGNSCPLYDNATQGTRNGYPAYAELQIRNMGKKAMRFCRPDTPVCTK